MSGTLKLTPAQARRVKGYSMTLGSIENRNLAPRQVEDDCQESYGTREGENNSPETCADGCGSWSRSWAQRNGKFSLRNMTNAMAWKAEQRALDRPTYQVALDVREKNRKVADQAIHGLFTQAAPIVDELKKWASEELITSDEDTRVIVKKTLIWKSV